MRAQSSIADGPKARHLPLMGGIALACLLLTGVAVAATGQTRHAYDDLGRLVRVERPDGTILTYTYDADGNITNKTVIHDADFDGTVDAVDTCTDTDGDGYGNPGFPSNTCVLDCAPVDPTTSTVPTDLRHLSVAVIPGGHRLSWDSQSSTAGTSTHYDIFTGRIDLIMPAGSFSSGSCMAQDRTAVSYDDMSPPPAAGQCFYYLVRGHNICGMGSYGNANRDTTAASSPGACH